MLNIILNIQHLFPALMSQPAIQTNDDLRQAILDAARERFLHFGYHKTTMAEIADDVAMSAANLYRYFANKQEIVAECASQCMNERLDRLRVLVQQPQMSAADKLRQYVFELIDDNHALAGPESRIGELVGNITRERRELVHAKHAVQYALLEDILSQGVAAQEFDCNDLKRAATTIHSALALFDVPLFVGFYERAEFERRGRDVIEMILHSLTAPPSDFPNKA